MKETEALRIIGEFTDIIENPDNFDYDVVIENMQKTADVLKKYPNFSEYADSSFIRGIKTHYVADFYSNYLEIFKCIMQSKNKEEQKKYLKEIEAVDEKLRTGLEKKALECNHEFLDNIFNQRLQRLYEKSGPNFNSQIMELFKFAETSEKCEQMLQKVFDIRVSAAQRYKNMLLISEVYKQFPQVIDTAFEIIKKDKNNPYYFKALTEVALFDELKAEEALSYMHSRVQEGPVDEFLLQKYYKELKAVSDALPKFKNSAQELCREALISDKNSPKSKKEGARLLEDERALSSQISIGKKVEKSTDNRFGYEKVKSIEADEVCVLFLGGNGSQFDKVAHGYIKPVVELLKENGLSDKVNVYGITYDFGDYFEWQKALEMQMKQHGHKPVHSPEFLENVHQDTKEPQFLKQLFDKFILPRISRLNGKVKLSAKEAATNLNKLKIIAHCFGGYAALELEKMSLNKMKALGYTPEETKKIQKQLQIIGINPYCPLGVQKSDMFSVISAQDNEVTHNNMFEKYIRHLVSKGKIIPLCFFDKKLGNFLLVNRMYGSDNRLNTEIDKDEHGYYGFKVLPTNSPQGKIAIKFMQNALLKGIKSALRNEIRDLSTKELLTNNDEELADFDKAAKNADKLHQNMVEYAFAQSRKKIKHDNNK